MFLSTKGMTYLVGKDGGVEGPLVEVPDGEDGDAAVVEHWVLLLFSCFMTAITQS